MSTILRRGVLIFERLFQITEVVDSYAKFFDVVYSQSTSTIHHQQLCLVRVITTDPTTKSKGKVISEKDDFVSQIYNCRKLFSS